MNGRHLFIQCTEVRFASLLSSGFTTMAVINTPEKKLANRTSVHCVTKREEQPPLQNLLVKQIVNSYHGIFYSLLNFQSGEILLL